MHRLSYPNRSLGSKRIVLSFIDSPRNPLRRCSLKTDKSKDSGTSGARGKRPGSAGGHRDKGYNKRFQRLESHVVTLARSVAHLSSEMRNLQVVIQEVDSLRAEMQQGRQLAGFLYAGYTQWCKLLS